MRTVLLDTLVHIIIKVAAPAAGTGLTPTKVTPIPALNVIELSQLEELVSPFHYS